MNDRTDLATVAEVHKENSWLFTVTNTRGTEEEVVLVRCDDGVEAWVNSCTHEAQRLDRGFGVAVRDGQIICPKHGSMFDSCSGHCDNGKAADTTLIDVDIAVEDGIVYLTDDEYTFAHEGGLNDGDDDPESSSHLAF